jgi:hypothetical protein
MATGTHPNYQTHLIARDSRIHLVACVEITKASRIADTQKNCRDRTMENSMPKKICPEKFVPPKIMSA